MSRGTYDDASEVTDVYDDEDEYRDYLEEYDDYYYEQWRDDEDDAVYAPKSRGAWRACR